MASADWERQRMALRSPRQILGPTFEEAGIAKEAARVRVRGAFVELLEQLQVVLLVSREYENLVVALRAQGGRLLQSFLPIPHPSGMALCRQRGRLYVAATRNPNYLAEFIPVSSPHHPGSWWAQSRTKFYPGHYYFHDLVCDQGQLYANSVGQNGVIRVDFDRPEPEELCWWPRCVEDEQGRPNTSLNYLQLNSIALGSPWDQSLLTASCATPSRRRPWHLNYPVDGRGVLFSAATREVVGRGLTRPHSARFYQGQVWVNNSGYGQLGYFQGDQFCPVWSFDSWTRGLAFHPAQVAWVGLSRVLPKYAHYAPGLQAGRQCCGLVALCLRTRRVLGSLTWPSGNQIFAIEWADAALSQGFPLQHIRPDQKRDREQHYRYQAHERKA